MKSYNRRQQLEELEAALEPLCELLRLGREKSWLQHFESCLAETRLLLEAGFDQPALNELSRTVRHVYGGMGSFNDYVPPMNTAESSAWYKRYGSPDLVSGQVYDCALALMVVGER